MPIALESNVQMILSKKNDIAMDLVLVLCTFVLRNQGSRRGCADTPSTFSLSQIFASTLRTIQVEGVTGSWGIINIQIWNRSNPKLNHWVNRVVPEYPDGRLQAQQDTSLEQLTFAILDLSIFCWQLVSFSAQAEYTLIESLQKAQICDKSNDDPGLDVYVVLSCPKAGSMN